MKKIRIFDSSFTSKSASLSDENMDHEPSHIEWIREGSPTDPTFITDSWIKEIGNIPKPARSIAWLREPRPLHPEDYEEVEKSGDYFDHILTYDLEFALKSDKSLFYYSGGSRISFDLWGIHPKEANLSIIASDKNSLEGHKLRHEIIRKFGWFFDGIYGTGRNYIKSKYIGLAPFRYAVEVESCKFDYYFTEQLIDCLSMGTVPIYWGCPSIGNFFDPGGIIQFNNLDDLYSILRNLSVEDYESRTDAIAKNLILARQYAIAEDWIYENQRELF